MAGFSDGLLDSLILQEKKKWDNFMLLDETDDKLLALRTQFVVEKMW